MYNIKLTFRPKIVLQSIVVLMLLLNIPAAVVCQAQSQSIVTNLSAIDGVELTPANVFSYQFINNTGASKDITVKGSIRYKASNLSASYTYNINLQPGLNQISKDRVYNASWVFSDNAFRELFFDYGKMPQGTYEYCVSVTLSKIHTEAPVNDPIEACLYQTVNDIFLINLVDPEDNAKLYELNPALSWVVNFPFASALTYRIRVAEIKNGQNNESAITRNNPVYQDNRVTSTGVIYPVTAKPLQKFQPYAWTVDAYYKGILLGGAAPWRFTIIEDSFMLHLPKEQPYINVRASANIVQTYAIGSLKIKYVLDEMNEDSITLKLTAGYNGKEIKLKQQTMKVAYGDNFFACDFYNDYHLKNLNDYVFTITNAEGKKYIIPFKYISPDYIKD